MVKRNRGKGKSKRKAITKRDRDAKKTRRASEAPEDSDPGSDAAPDSDAGSDSDKGSDSDAGADSDPASDPAPDPKSAHDSDAASDSVAARDGDDADDGGPAPLAGGAEWALPLLKFDHKWTWLETRLMFVALLALTCVLCLWFGIRGMKEPLQAVVPAGTIWRAIVGAAVLGGLARALTRNRLDEKQRNIATSVAIVVGLAVAKSWRGVGIDYFAGLNDWLQEGSTLTLFGGLKGISTRLTMLVALMGGSLAASSGTHINIDIVIRLIPKSVRKPVAILGSLATALVCLMASWGFLDHVAITGMKAELDGSAGHKLGAVTHKLSDDFWVWRKQVVFDIGAVPYVLQGKRWNDPERFKGKDWNAWLDDSGIHERYGADKTARLRAPDDALEEPWTPFVVLPTEDTRGMLVHSMDLLWPIGFLALGLRFLLRALLLFAGQIRMRIEGEDEEGKEAA